MSDKRLSGNQLVVIALAVCAALVLAPIGVYAAAVQKVRLVDAKNASRAVKVTPGGRVQADVRGSVRADTKPASAFSVSFSGDTTLPQLFGSSSRIAITSITAANASGVGSFYWIYKYTDGTCSELDGYFAYLGVLPGSTESATFPTPVIVTQKCALFHAGAGPMTITGYRLP